MKKRHIGMFFAISMLALTQIGTSAHALLTPSVTELHFIDIMGGVKSVSQTVTFENRDSEDAKILSASSSEKDLTGSFKIIFPRDVILKTGEKITLQVSLVSTSPELVVDEEDKKPITLVLYVQRPSGTSTESTVLLKAYKSGTGISGSPWPLAFSNVKKGGRSEPLSVTIKNPMPFGLSVKLDQTPNFALADGQSMTIPPKSQGIYSIYFRPTVEGLQSGNLQIVTDDKDALLLGAVPISGTGIAADVPSTVKEEEKPLEYSGGTGCQATSFGKTAGDASSLVLFSAALGLLILFRSLMVRKRKAA